MDLGAQAQLAANCSFWEGLKALNPST